MRILPHLMALALATSTGTVAAQQRPLDDLVSTDPLDDDPIGIDDESDLSRVQGPPGPERDETPEEVARRGPRPPSVSPSAGEVVTAINAVRETHHDVTVELEDGLAWVTTELTLSSRARHPAEVRYRLAVPEGAALASLRVCIADRCRDGVALGDAGRAAYDAAVRARGDEDGAPIASAEHLQDARGSSISILAAPVPPRGTLIVEVRYVTRAPIIGGVARLTLPGRGQDPRAAPTTVHVRAPSMIGVSVDGLGSEAPLVRDAWYPIAVSAQLRTAARTAARITRFSCGDARCARATVTSGPRGGAPLNLVLALDASPSTEGPARSRIAPTVAAILSALPRGSRVWALSFGAEARTIVESPRAPDDVPLVPLARSVNRELGSATRVEKAIERARTLLESAPDERLSAHLVIIGDGGITRGREARLAFESARRAAMRVSVVDVADRPTWPQLREGALATGGAVIEVGREAERAARGQSTAELEEKVARLFAPDAQSNVALVVGGRRIELGALVAGEQVVWEGVVPSRGRLALRGVRGATSIQVDEPRARALAGVVAERRTALYAVDRADATAAATGTDAPCVDERGPARRASGVSADDAPVALAIPRSCTPRAPTVFTGTADPSLGRGVPAETVLRMLRERVVPVARRCFRRDRAGRLDYAVRATFTIRLEDRELTEATVNGRISDALRSCLMTAAHHLDVPRFRGAVVVRYPLYTERMSRPPVIELIPEVAREVDAVAPPEDGD